MGLADIRKGRGVTQDDLAVEVGLKHKGSISAIETGSEPPSLEVAMRIQVWSDGEVPAAELRPDLADLLAAFVRTAAARAPVPA